MFGGHGCSRSSCHGGGGGLFHRGGRGCSSGCSGSYCTGAVVCSGSACTGACTGGTPVPPKAKEMIKEPVKDKKTAIEAPATIVVSLPADARLIVDGNTTKSTTDRRTLVTPALQFGSTYIYDMTAEIVREGRTITQTQQVSVRGGETVAVQFNFPTQTVASR